MPFLTVHPEGRIIEFKTGSSLADILTGAGVFVDNACGGKGLCGKCRIRIISGPAGDITETERRLLKPEELETGIRLGCLVFPDGDLTAEPLQKEKDHDVLTTGYPPDFEFRPDIVKMPVTIHKPTLDDQTPFEDQILQQTGASGMDHSALSICGMRPGEYTAVVSCDKVTMLEHGDTASRRYGAAVDIGTTTVVCSLVDMNTGDEIGSASDINAQKHFGLDVLTRITYEIEHPDDGASRLSKAIVGSINNMLGSVCAMHGVSTDEIYEITVGANCTMMHMLLGVDATPIGKAPYAPVFADAKNIPAASIGLKAAPGARLYCLPSVSAYIGADIVAGAYVCGLKHLPGNTIFIDIGTNGEIVLASKGHLMSCSCAAGPALEGMNISSGMRAEEGAIEDISISEDGIDLKVIGDSEPAGICGSGILTVTKELLRTGIVRSTGAFIRTNKLSEDDYRLKYIKVDEAGKRSFRMTEGEEPLYITQSDVRQVQLAKGAILSGFMALMKRAGIGMEDLDQVLIAGQFGAHLPASSITGTGILPFEVEDKIRYVGNTSKTGAYMALMSSDVKKQMEELAHEMDYLELGATGNYERLLSECLIFPEF